MVSKIPKVLSVSPEDVQSVLFRARQVDPQCAETAVRRYLLEIQEAEAMLDLVDLTAVPLEISFRPLSENQPRK